MKVLVISCHPDDAEIYCCGTLLKCKQRGDEVTVCHVANGNMGHVQIMPEELRTIRLEEAQSAGRIGGFKVRTVDVGDLRVYESDVSQLNEVVRVIREEKPDFIITHAPQDYMIDHRAVSELVFKASFIASVPHYEPELGDATPTTPLYYFETSAGLNFNPTEYVDISDVIETKMAMLACHQSQYKWLMEHDNVDVAEQLRVSSRFRGIQCGVQYAEAFCQEYCDHKVIPKRLLP